MHSKCFESKFKSLEELIREEETNSCNLRYIERGKDKDLHCKLNSFEQLIQSE